MKSPTALLKGLIIYFTSYTDNLVQLILKYLRKIKFGHLFNNIHINIYLTHTHTHTCINFYKRVSGDMYKKNLSIIA